MEVTSEASSPTLAPEIWRPIPGFPLYRASSHGQIMNVKTGRILKPFPITSKYSDSKYMGVRLQSPSATAKDGAISKSVHRLIALTFPDLVKGPKNWPINHKNGRKSENHTDNLERVTPKQNAQHAVETGLFHRKWQPVEVQEMFRMRASGMLYRDIQAAFEEMGKYLPHATLCTIMARPQYRAMVVA